MLCWHSLSNGVVFPSELQMYGGIALCCRIFCLYCQFSSHTDTCVMYHVKTMCGDMSIDLPCSLAKHAGCPPGKAQVKKYSVTGSLKQLRP